MNTIKETAIGQYLTDTFDIIDFKPMFFGATIMDTDNSAGYDPKEMNTYVKTESQWTPQTALTLYPEASGFENEEIKEGEIKVDVSMCCCWINGFIPNIRGILEPSGMSRNTKNFFSGRAVVTTDQIFKSKKETAIAALIHKFSWYGSDGVNMLNNGSTKIDESFMTKAKDDEYNKILYHKGMVCSAWNSRPVPIRYMVHVKPHISKKMEADYVYFIGGSNDVIGDNIDNIPAYVYQTMEKIRSLKEDGKKIKFDNDKLEEGWKCTPEYIWWAYNENKNQHPIVIANLLGKKMIRTIESIFFIRNYLVYAQKELLVEKIKEFGWKDGEPTIKEIKISDLIQKYDRIYAYCKNLCYVFKNDIATCNLL